MGKQKRKEHQKPVKKSKWERTCERCGNDSFSPMNVWKCPYCWWWNGIENTQKEIKDDV